MLAITLVGLLLLVCAQFTALAQTSPAPAAFGQGAPIARQPALSIILTKTVGTAPNGCATTNIITVAAGTPFYYCYTVQNTGAVTLTTHTIKDTQYISPLKNQAFHLLKPGPPPDSITIVTATVSGVQQTTVSTGTWVAATVDGQTTAASDSTTVLVPALEVKATVGTKSSSCATAKQVNVMPGTKVTFCYTVHNPGKVTLRLQSVKDNQGIVRANWAKVLAPGATTYLTSTSIITQTTKNVVAWTGYVTNTTGIATIATDSVVVNTPRLDLHVTVGLDPTQCATTAAITVTANTEVYYCYMASNTGGVTLTRHEIDDSLSVAPYIRQRALPPQTSYAYGVAATITKTLVNYVTWTASTGSGADGLSTSSSNQATVTVVYSAPIFVFYDVDNNGRFNPLERGMPNVVLRLNQFDQVLTKTTDLNGKAVFSNVHAGTYTVTVDEKSLPPGFTLTTSKTVFTAELQTGAAEVEIGYTSPPDFNTDCDGIPDRLEGPGDSNLNGIPDYLDANCMYLPVVQR
ncbi:MAG: SdrD B-like domain-containing protein [Caldilineaceae bacterium]